MTSKIECRDTFKEFNVFVCRKSSVGMLGVLTKKTGHEIRKERVIDHTKNTLLVESEIPDNIRKDSQ